MAGIPAVGDDMEFEVGQQMARMVTGILVVGGVAAVGGMVAAAVRHVLEHDGRPR